MSRLVKNTKRAILILTTLVVLALVIHLAYAAYSGTKRLLGPETVFETVTATGTITLGTASTDGSLRLYCHDSPPTCDADAKGELYCDDSESRLKYCNGTAWTAL